MNHLDHAGLPIASRQEGTHPRPQLLRRLWADLSGMWEFAFDDDDRGEREGWWRSPRLPLVIRVPYPPESRASELEDTRHHRTVWYHRRFDVSTILETGHAPGNRLMLRFGAVDYRARVWIDGKPAGSHEGGHTPFSLDVTDLLDDAPTHDLVVRAEDDPHDIAQPRGKQDWQENPHIVWYHRTTGIWQPVWLESVPAIAVEQLQWSCDPTDMFARLRVVLSRPLTEDTAVRVSLALGKRRIGEVVTVAVDTTDIDVVIPIAELANGQGYHELLWSPERPRLIDAIVEVGEDRVSSYFGIRTVAANRGSFLLNYEPYYVRSVLQQGYWPDSLLAAPSAAGLREDVQRIKDLGFNSARIHQKFEDPRMLYWADRLGLLVWGEAPATFSFTPTSVERTVREWLEVVRRDISHPSIAVWVPLNESWGIQHVARDPRMLHFARSLVELTKSLDPTRPVVSNDGWEQVDTDILAIHDYTLDPATITARYRDRGAVDALLRGPGPAGRQLVLSGESADIPVMLSEFGGISYDIEAHADSWGYAVAHTSDEFAELLEALLGAVHASESLAGFCYTQLTDTLQETNGLLTERREPKLPDERVRAAVIGTHPDPARH